MKPNKTKEQYGAENSNKDTNETKSNKLKQK